MAILIHGANASPFVRKVRIALAEKSVPYEQNPIVPFGLGDDYKQKSPLGKIPCLEEGDFVLPDSSCILAYLERTHPKPALYPTDPKEFARALWYEEYADSKVVEVLGPIFFERFVKKNFMKQEPDEERLAKIMAEDQPPVFSYLEQEIGDRDYLVGKQFSVADIAVTSPFINAEHAGERVDAKRFPKLAAYLERNYARPSLKAIREEEEAAFSQMG